MTARDPLDNWLTRRLVAVGKACGMRGDPDGVGEILRRYGVRPGPPPPTVDAPDPGGGRPPLVGRENDPSWMFPFRSAWRDLARQASTRRAGPPSDEGVGPEA